MDIFRFRPRGALALAVAALLLLGWGSPARAAEPDWSMVAESISEAGYYVDSNAAYFRTDAALDQLRGAQDRSTVVFIAVFPGSIDPKRAITQLKSAMNRRGTFAVLSGGTLQVASTALPQKTVRQAHTKAVKANPNSPAKALVAFIRQLDERKVGNQVIGRTRTPKPTSKHNKTSTAAQPGAPLPGAAQTQQARPAGSESDSGGPGALVVVLGLAALAAAGAGAFIVLRRRAGGASAQD